MVAILDWWHMRTEVDKNGYGQRLKLRTTRACRKKLEGLNNFIQYNTTAANTWGGATPWPPE